MLFLVRLLLIVGALSAIVYSGLYMLGAFVVPEAREIIVPVPMPKSYFPLSFLLISGG